MECRTEKKRTFADVITSEEYTLLLTGEVQRAIAAARDRDPIEVAKDRRVPHARLVATQVKYLARAAQKLPSYATAQCILPPLAFEQASSEACAAHKRIGGDTVLDLTCGLGVDTFFLSRRFGRVVTLERNDVLARVAAENFSRLGATNIEVVNTSAEEYLRRDGLHFDWIYADPDRRSAEGRKLVRLEDCSPDIIALKPLLDRVSGRLCIKNSPLFDIGEALRLFPDSHVEVVSLDGECKEVLVYADGTGPLVTATALGHGSFSARPGDTAPEPETFDPARCRWLVVPDVALQKARLVRLHLAGGRRLERKRLRIRRRRAAGRARTDLRRRADRTLRSQTVETRTERPRGRGAQTRLPAGGGGADAPPRTASRSGTAAGFHENRERFLGYPLKITTFA